MAKKILVVDDSATVRQQVAMVLTEAGFAVIEAVDGADGLAKLRATADVSMVICDMNMPNVNGLELVERAMATPKASHPPILMLTTEGNPDLVARAKKAGAKGWMVKPFKPELLLAAAQKLAG